MTEDYQQPEDLTISAYDAREQQLRFEMERRRADQIATAEERHHQRNLQRLRLMGTITAATACVLIVVGVTYVVWLALRGPSAQDVQRQEARLECIDEGGIWIPGTNDSRNGDSTFGTCTFSRGDR